MEFILTKAAKTTGGDKYTNNDKAQFSIYIPQYISRRNGKVISKLVFDIVYVEDDEEDDRDGLEFHIHKNAKGHGGDAYKCDLGPKASFIIYVPQIYSRKDGYFHDILKFVLIEHKDPIQIVQESLDKAHISKPVSKPVKKEEPTKFPDVKRILDEKYIDSII